MFCTTELVNIGGKYGEALQKTLLRFLQAAREKENTEIVTEKAMVHFIIQ